MCRQHIFNYDMNLNTESQTEREPQAIDNISYGSLHLRCYYISHIPEIIRVYGRATGM